MQAKKAGIRLCLLFTVWALEAVETRGKTTAVAATAEQRLLQIESADKSEVVETVAGKLEDDETAADKLDDGETGADKSDDRETAADKSDDRETAADKSDDGETGADRRRRRYLDFGIFGNIKKKKETG